MGTTVIRKLPRRWMRFSLSSILLVVTVCGMWLGVRVNRARNERAALQDFRQLGAMVHFTYQKAGEWDWDWQNKMQSNIPSPLLAVLGEEFFHEIGHVSFHDHKVGPEQLELISRLSALNDLSLQEQTHLNDEALDYIQDLTSLENLCLWDMQVTDAGLASLKKLTALRGLGLNRTKITNAGLEQLAKFKHLKILELEGTQVTEEGVRRLRRSLPDCDIRF